MPSLNREVINIMLKKSTIAAAMLFTLCGNVSATETNGGAGSVNFKGLIVQAPCSIKQESLAQEVEFESQIFTSTLSKNANDASTIKEFNIELSDCEVTKDSQVDITFNGNTDPSDQKLLQIYTGSDLNGGAAIKIMNGNDGTEFIFGQKAKAGNLVNGSTSHTLTFKAQVVKVGDEAVTPGQFTAAANFILSYP